MAIRGRSTLEKLAVEGGIPVRITPFPAWPSFEPEDIDAAAAVLRSGKVNYWTGDEGRLFEQEFAAHTGTRYAVALANGTAALELALHALDVGPGDEVITPCRSFIASASCIVMRGATPVMVDVDRDSQTITADIVKRAITPRTRAVIAVHLAGWPCDMDSILKVAALHNLAVIEDCAQAHGASYKGRRVGSMGHVGAFSFCQDKIMTTGGEGGMFTTNDKSLWGRAWSYRDHGKSYDAVYNQQHSPGYRWVYESLGTNWRLTEVQSALGRRMLRRLDDDVARRNCHAARLNEAFARIAALRVTRPPTHIRHAYYKYYVFVRPDRLREGWNRDRIMASITAEGIPCYAGSCSEIYLEKAFDGLHPQRRRPVASALGEMSLMLLVHPTISDDDLEDTITAVRKVVEHASR
ncbi:MAG TPA: DegT/DnrJ/EryC1/StrS aminotransferase family protein [Candidatus Eisenbacteria bacterium]|nr:DegT/DnrJ/EryC1/StrS aminotransferase family protein [Candidatus Eisenbacteria bacterium]